ncbi:efflux RND transporter periplasmic adaptor subunit [uncultured Psychrobacter sp.]|uniref:efflux RND transporter periplasmic adaptor subunit n=1 Tax=uncultured Psychrobacter sp. TaxID=259303 RepID=UPI00345AAF24
MSSIRFIKCCKNGAVLLSILLLIGCQPSPSDNQQVNEGGKSLESPVTIGADSVTMTSDYILDVKSSRYQPSLGLQGVIEPTKQARFVAAHDALVQKVLVKPGQWIEEGAPLLVVQRLNGNTKTDTTSTTDAAKPKVDNAIPVTDLPVRLSQNEEENSNNNENTSENALKTSETDNETVVDDGNNEEGDQINSSGDDGQSLSPTQISTPSTVIRASFSGRVDELYVQAEEQIDAGTPLLHLTDDQDLRFTATLPLQAESQLSVGQTVNFTADNMSEKFTGQISKLVFGDEPNQLLVHVHVINNEVSRNILKPGMMVTGRVDYGQIEVGTIVPVQGIHDVDLSVLKKPPYQSLTPLVANVWIIKQDQRLTRQPVEVIKYDPSTDQYLVAGISNDSLICLADLPPESAGKKVIVS